MSQAPKTPLKEIRPLTGIRGIAALGVVFYHCFPAWTLLLPGLAIFSPLAMHGTMGVDLFFILSGFILSYVYSNTIDGNAKLGRAEYFNFIGKRLARIYPNHIATLGILLLLIAISKPLHLDIYRDNYPLNTLPFQLTLTHVWPFAPSGLWNYPSWSISAEWFAYLTMFPLTWHLVRRHWSSNTFLIFSYASLGLFFALAPLLMKIPCDRPLALPEVCLEFLAGSMLFGAWRSGSAIIRSCQRYSSLVFVLIFAACAPFHPGKMGWTIVLLFPVLLLGLTSENSWIGRLLSTKPALWLGRVSYAMYMSHAIAQQVFRLTVTAENYAGASLPVRLVVVIADFSLIIAFAAALYYLVEIPGRNALQTLAKRWSHQRARNAATAACKLGTS